MHQKKGFTPIIIIGIVVLGLAIVGGGGYYLLNKQNQKEVSCTKEAKVCSDGSSVVRTGPNCEFKPCPEEVKIDETKPFIKIISPDGEELAWGKSYDIKWISSKASLKVNILLDGYDQLGKVIQQKPGKSIYIANAVENNGLYRFTLTNQLLDSFEELPLKYKIRITPAGGTLGLEEDYQGESVAFFIEEALINAISEGNLEKVKELIKSGTDVNTTNDHYGRTPLIFACISNNLEILKELIRAGADVNGEDSNGKTALIYASYYGHADIVQILKEAGASE